MYRPTLHHFRNRRDRFWAGYFNTIWLILRKNILKNPNDRWELNRVALTLLNSCLPGKAVLNNIKCVWSMWNGWLSHNSMMDTRKEKSHGFDAIVEKNNTYSVKEANSPAHCVGVCIFIERYPVICLDEHWKRVQCTENQNGFLIVLLF